MLENDIIKIYKKACESGNHIFMTPKKLYTYNEIINGVKVGRITMKAVDESTFQAFGRFNENMRKSQSVYREYFNNNEKKIINSLNGISTQNELGELEEEIFSNIHNKLLKDTDNGRLNSYNRIRKPINLYLEHIVSMAQEINKRKALVPMLYLPLDKVIFGSDYVFNDSERRKLNINPNLGFGQISAKEHYNKLQIYLKRKSDLISQKIGVEFYKIYFDMFWKERYLHCDDNLFYSNLSSDGNREAMKIDIINKQKKEVYIMDDKTAFDINIKKDNDNWEKLISYKPNTQVLVKSLAELLDGKGVKLSPKFRGDKAIVFALSKDMSKNILTIWERRGGVFIRILKWGDELCLNPEEFTTKGIIDAARRKYEEIS